MITALIYFENPLLLVIPFAAMILSVIAAALPKVQILSIVSAFLHACFIAALIYFEAGLPDVFIMLALSLASSSIYNYITQKRKKGGNKQ